LTEILTEIIKMVAMVTKIQIVDELHRLFWFDILMNIFLFSFCKIFGTETSNFFFCVYKNKNEFSLFERNDDQNNESNSLVVLKDWVIHYSKV
jgi:hypothetical protein